ncbi:solute carrier organic anion transporter family member 4C1-like isoform X3 [Ostrea edulis]|uniref:solute carrier organic anion transporter family member 4C1-like isoform X3 n=1 Tax=Ostrea edulis TaxID=37623 RepID=UPI0024AF7911|nr:solute carrier organic anion transporter family member 4C1-like isoform X3 [Ostrea edulis]
MALDPKRVSRLSVSDGDELLPLTESDLEVMSETETAVNNGTANGTHMNGKMSIKPKPMHMDEESQRDTRCGFGSYSPNCLQKFNNPKALLFFLCAFCMLQGFVVNGVNNVNTTSIERRFELPSSRVGTISSAYDVSAAILGIIISYFGSGKNKSRMVAFSCLIMSLGSFIMALPHFSTGLYQYGQNLAESCRDPVAAALAENSCSSDSENHLQRYLYVFLLGQTLHGIGGTTLYIVGVALIDDSVPSTASPLYVGIMYSFATLGPALGYVIGGQLLNLYVDFHEVDSVSITTDDPRWVGAWWVGFAFASVLFLIVSIPIFGYGKELPTAQHVRETRVTETHTDNTSEQVVKELGKSVKDMPRSFWLLVKNPAFLFITLAGTFEGFSTSGMATFLPKLIQNQFGTSAAWAAILGGLIAVPGAAGGQFVGGMICKRWKLKVRGMLRLNVIVCVIALLLDAVIWVRCDLQDIAGVSVGYVKGEPQKGLTSPCNSNCSCTTEMYEPVCSELGVQYFSPCHAGCSGKVGADDTYSNCTCVSTDNFNFSSLPVSFVPGAVKKGKCNSDCMKMYIFLPVLLLSIFFRFVESPPSVAITLRCIHDSQRTFALGIQWFIGRLLGTVPGPIFFGAVIDSTCLVWQEKCNEKASCWIYDNLALSRNFFFILIIVKILAAIMFGLAYKFYNPPVEKVPQTSVSVNHTTENGIGSPKQENEYVSDSSEDTRTTTM